MNEKISALMDAELDKLEERRVLETLARDADLRRTWERYHLARAAMTNQLDYVAPSRVAEGVYAQLQHVPLVVDRGRNRWVGGLAVAASIAALAIIGLPALQRPDAPTTPTLAVNTFTPTGSRASATEVPDEPREGRLNAYLVGHNEFMPTAGMGGMLPYVRVVTYDREK